MSEVRKYSNKFVEMVEEGILDPVEAVRMCVKWMSEDDVKLLMDANEIEYEYPEEEDEENDEQKMKRFFVAIAKNGYKQFFECELPENVALPALDVHNPQDYEIYEITKEEYNEKRYI